MRHGQSCMAGKCGSGNIGTVLQGVENAGVEFAGGCLQLQDLKRLRRGGSSRRREHRPSTMARCVCVGDHDRALLFATDDQLHLLSEASVMYMDATFRVVPSVFHQMFIVLVPYAVLSVN